MPRTIPKWIQKLVMGPTLGRIDALEDRVAAMAEAHRWVADSPVRFEIMREKLKRAGGGPDRSLARYIPAIIAGVSRSMTSLKKNPRQPIERAPEGFLADVEQYARSLGVSSVGYTRVPERWVFQGKALLHLNAIVLTMEMDKTRIDTAPSPAGAQTVFETYRDLGVAANKIAAYLRRHGYSAHAAHPLMGPALYPPLAQMAGLGWLGTSGLIVTPEHGPRVRLAAVLTNIENLPSAPPNEHAWVAEFCAQCQICVRKCPAEAILPEPIHHENGQITCVSTPRCFPYFCDHHGCSVCIKVCPFNNTRYERIKQGLKAKE